MTAKPRLNSAMPMPNSEVIYGLMLERNTRRSKMAWMKKLWLACNTTAGQRVPDFIRNQAYTKLIPKHNMKKQISTYQIGAPLL